MVKCELLQLGRPAFPTLLATPTPPTKMRALAAVQSLDTAHHMHSLLLSHGNEWNTSALQSQDTAHHMHSLLLSHGNEWNISSGRDQGAAMVKYELLQLGAP